MDSLKDRRILLAVTGGIAAYKSCELARLLKKQGATVQVAMTEHATQFVTPLTFEALTGLPVLLTEWREGGGAMPHIAAGFQSDLILVAPATANILAKAACGIADDLVSTLIAARRAPVAFAPAMNTRMWTNPPCQRNVQQLKEDGALVWGPASGGLACGETGAGRMLEPAELLERTISFFSEKYLDGKKLLITAGPTYEPIDPVRGLTNRSSGKQGFALAQAAARAGACVTLVAGPCALPTPFGVERIDVLTAKEMREAVLARVSSFDIFIAVAAVCDWKPTEPLNQKIKKIPGNEPPAFRLELNPDILSEVGHLPESERPFTVGFAAETQNVEAYAREKLERKNANMIAGNQANQTLGSDRNTVHLVTQRGVKTIGPAPKGEISQGLLREIASHLQNQQKAQQPNVRR